MYRLVGIPVEAKRAGLIDQVRPFLDVLRDVAGFRVDEALYRASVPSSTPRPRCRYSGTEVVTGAPRQSRRVTWPSLSPGADRSWRTPLAT